MDNPLARRDLVDAILELRQEAERRLLANKYYVAMTKLDELLAAIRPLDIIEATPRRTEIEATPRRAEPAPHRLEAPVEPRAETESESAPDTQSEKAPDWGAAPEPRAEPSWRQANEPVEDRTAHPL